MIKQNPMRTWRESRGLTVTEAAILLGTRASVICGIESGDFRPPARIMADLVAFGVDPSAFEKSYSAFIKERRASIRARAFTNTVGATQ